MHRYRAPSIAPGTFFVAQSWADFIINMSESNLRQAQAVNHTRDNDTVAAIVGAAVGALHGESALPQRWRNGLLGRTRESDDGQVQRILSALEDRLSL
jgi:ADP-ribosylglycohydrolase